MITITDKRSRGNLGEGRSYGLGFGFLKKVKEDTYQTIMPISPCKDYLNDVVYAEMTGNNCSAYGLSAKKKNIFDDTWGYMALKVCHYLGGEKYERFDMEQEALTENIENLQLFINWFENELNLESRTSLELMKNKTVFAQLPLYWCKSTWLISMWSLLIRVGRWYNDPSVNPLKYLSTFKVLSEDTYILSAALPKIDNILKVKEINQPMEKLYDENAHNCGILCYPLAKV